MCDILFGLYFIFRNFKTETVFWVFLFKSMWREWRVYSCSRKSWGGGWNDLFPDHLALTTSSTQLQPRHHNIDNFLWYHIIVYIFSMKTSHGKTPFHTNISLLLINSLKSIFTFKIYLMKPETFDFKSLSTFHATTIPPSTLLTCF